MRQRCPSARFVGVAILRDHRRAFTRRSINRGCGVAAALPAVGQELWGTVFEMSDDDLAALDKSEGCQAGRDKNSYWRRECEVYRGGVDQPPISVATYFADRQPDPPLPNRAYTGLILSGARRWNLPKLYTDQLGRIECSP